MRSGDIIAEIETDKTTMEVETIEDGIVGKLLVPAGAENVAVNATIAILINDAGDAISDVASADPAAAAEQPAVSVPVPLHLSGCNALRRKGTRKRVTLGITPHRASGSGCGSNRDVPACLKHSGASPGKARCSELIAIDAQSTSPHDLPDVLGCAYRPRRCARCSIRGSVRPG